MSFRVFLGLFGIKHCPSEVISLRRFKMAASLFARSVGFRGLKTILKPCIYKSRHCHKRFLLSQAYCCKEAWEKRLEDPLLNQVPLSEFAVELRDQHEKQNVISAVDMEILANKLHDMAAEEASFMEDLMIRFRKCPQAYPIKDRIVYCIVRNYIDADRAQRLLPLMKARSETGIFPDSVALSLLLDHFIVKEDFGSAAQVAYEVMLQEDFSHPISSLLALYACVHHWHSVSLQDIAPAQIRDPASQDDEEEDWVKVNYIRFPVYDDHFDIQCEQYLLGKSLFLLSQVVGPEESSLRAGLQVLGLGLYHKFPACLQLLQGVADSPQAWIPTQVLASVRESLEKVQVRDPNRPQKDFGVMTIEDEIYKLLPTQEEKEAYQQQLTTLEDALQRSAKVKDERLSTLLDTWLQGRLAQHEAVDIELQERRLGAWREERGVLVQQQLFELERRHKMQEMESRLKELQDKEEMIRFFELNDTIRLAQPTNPNLAKYKAPWEEPQPQRLPVRRQAKLKKLQESS